MQTVEELQDQVRTLAGVIANLENRTQFFEALLRSLPGIFYVFDENLMIQRWNENARLVSGFTEEEITRRSILDLLSGPDQDVIRASIKQVFAEGEGVAEAHLVTKDGSRIPYFFTGMRANIKGTNYLVGVGLDMTHKKAAEGALKESEALYRFLADRMTEGVLLCRGTQILFANNAMVQMLGYHDVDELMGVSPLLLISDSFTMYFNELYEALEAGVCDERFFQARWKKADGREVWVEGRGNRFTWQQQPSVVLTARDITETKLKEISMQEEADSLRRENVKLRSTITDRYRFGNIIGKSPAMQKVYELVLNAAATSANVIIYGESGTGKELVARAIHEMSSRAGKPFVPVNCAALPENLLESEFFGHKKGAFTGAHADKQGYLDLADGGTLFLDEVGELTPVLQVKLLRAIEGGGYSPVGSSVTRFSDFRIIAATNRDLLDMSRKGTMREDFFFRIHIIPITMPPLRQRKDDIPLLVEHFLRVYSKDKRPPQIPGQVLEALINYDWPGNVRELQNVIQRYLTVKRLDFLTTSAPMPEPEADMAAEPEPDQGSVGEAGPASDDVRLKDATASMEKNVIMEALEANRWNRSKTAEALGISRKTLFRKMKRFGLS